MTVFIPQMRAVEKKIQSVDYVDGWFSIRLIEQYEQDLFFEIEIEKESICDTMLSFDELQEYKINEVTPSGQAFTMIDYDWAFDSLKTTERTKFAKIILGRYAESKTGGLPIPEDIRILDKYGSDASIAAVDRFNLSNK